MKWKDIKFWLWIEVYFPTLPTGVAPENEELFDLSFVPRVPEFLTVEGPQDDCGPLPVDTPVCFDLLSFTSEFELNAIPTAAVSVAIGRRADDVDQAAGIHSYVDDLKLQLRARVWCQASTLAGSDLEPGERLWPEEKFMVFEGYVTGSGFRRNQSGAELTLSLTHWLTDLNFSSATSKQSHPLNPSQLFFPANFVLDQMLSGGGLLTPQGPMQVGSNMAIQFFPAPIIVEDFWGGFPNNEGTHVLGGMKDWLLSLTKTDRINAAQIRTAVGGGPASNLEPALNWEACRALQRFEPNAKTSEWEEDGYVLGVPLGLPSNADMNQFIAYSIGVEIGAETFESYTNVTLWDKLSGQFHANYMFSIVPLVEKALCVPFVPGLTDENDNLVHRTLWTRHYESIDLSATMPRPLRAMGVIIGKNFTAGGGLTHDALPVYSSFGGWFDKMTASPDPRYKEGLIMFKEGPRWMSNFVSNFLYTARSTGVLGTIQTVSSWAAGSPHAVDAPNVILQNSQTIWDLYARVLYIHEILKGRQGTITGPVRFDIAPGSTLKVEVTEDKYVKNLLHTIPIGPDAAICDDRFYTFFYCAVLRVSTTIDCQNARAFTSFYVAHVRSDVENEDPATSIETHPLWQKCRWGGCTLVQDTVYAPQVAKDCT